MKRRDVLKLAAAALGPRWAVRPVRVAVFGSVGDASFRLAVERAARGAPDLAVLDAGLVDAAARGAGYEGSLNMTREEARRLASVVGADALALSWASVVERATDNEKERFDGFLALFLADGRSGELVRYRGLRAAAAERGAAVEALSRAAAAEAREWGGILGDAARKREASTTSMPDDALDLLETPEGTSGTIPPRFFKRPVPAFTDDADRAHAVATVDLVVRFNADATYGPIEVARWAGYGLDESSIAAVRVANFWPARRAGRPVAARALLRFNFKFRDR